jgi:peptidoglycan hydrolase CwlO-like protein
VAEDEYRFFGRDAETTQLVNLIHENHLVILFGQSGTGKTSLIRAKLFPTLERLYLNPIYIRINFASEDPLEVTRRRIVTELRKWGAAVPEFQHGETLVEYTASISVFHGLIKPVLFFDQFEELFSLGYQNDRSRIDEFIRQLSDLVELRLPDSLKNAISIKNLIRFTTVLSLRQEWIAYLEDYKHQMPSMYRSRFRLKRFTTAQALEAILEPIRLSGYGMLSESTARQIILQIGRRSLLWDYQDTEDSTRNYSIDPILLNLYCYELFDLVKYHNQPVIDEALIEQNELKDLILTYYNEQLGDRDEIKLILEEKLINDAGRRITLPLKSLVEGTDITEEEIRMVALKTGLIHLIASQPNTQVEIVHDKVAEVMFEIRKARETDQKALERFKELDTMERRVKRLRMWSILAACITAIVIAISLYQTRSYVRQYIEDNTSLKVLHTTIDSLHVMLAFEARLRKGMDNEISEKSDEIGVAHAEISRLTGVAAFRNARIDDLSQQVRSKAHEINTLNDQISTLNQQISARNADNEQLGRTIQDKDGQIQTLTHDRDQKIADNAKLQTDLQNKTNDNAALSYTISTDKNQIATLNQQAREKDATITQLTTDKHDIENILASLRLQLNSCQEMLSRLADTTHARH